MTEEPRKAAPFLANGCIPVRPGPKYRTWGCVMKKYLWIAALFAAFALVFAGCASSGGGKADVLPDMDEAPGVSYEFAEVIDIPLGDWDGRKSWGFGAYLDDILYAGPGSFIRLSFSGVGTESQGMGFGDIASYIEDPKTGQWPPYRLIFTSKVAKEFNLFISLEDLYAAMFAETPSLNKTHMGNINAQLFNNFSGKIVGIRLYLTDPSGSSAPAGEAAE